MLTFEPGQTTRTINISILPDTVNEGDEQFYVDLTFVGGGNPLGDTHGVVTIIDDDNPTASDYVVSVGDAQMYEGNADLGEVDLPVTINSKRPKGAVDENVEVQIDIAYGTAGAADVFVKNLSPRLHVPRRREQEHTDQGARRHGHRTRRTADGDGIGTVEYARELGELRKTGRHAHDSRRRRHPRYTVAPKATTSTTKLGYVDFSWSEPFTGSLQRTTSSASRPTACSTVEPWVSTARG